MALTRNEMECISQWLQFCMHLTDDTVDQVTHRQHIGEDIRREVFHEQRRRKRQLTTLEAAIQSEIDALAGRGEY